MSHPSHPPDFMTAIIFGKKGKVVPVHNKCHDLKTYPVPNYAPHHEDVRGVEV
jgi:hypothetical protein